MAVQNRNLEIVKHLLSNDKIDVNILNILAYSLFFIKFKIKDVSNKIQNQIFEYNLKQYISIQFKIFCINFI